MSSGRFAATRDFNLEPSRLLASGLTTVDVGAAAAALVWLPAWLGVPACVLLAMSLRRELSRHCGAESLCHLHRGPDRLWRLRDRRGRPFEAELAGSTCVTPLITVASFRVGRGCRRAAVILPDSAPAHVRRRLRVALRYPD
ncbi:MAG TPA: protein YgfX [Gammaproteobacteria bacterium]|nr:protein YgfX [Gammaproteobacteria bacterium]